MKRAPSEWAWTLVLVGGLIVGMGSKASNGGFGFAAGVGVGVIAMVTGLALVTRGRS